MNHQMISRSDESQRTDRNTASLKKEIHLYVHSVPYFLSVINCMTCVKGKPAPYPYGPIQPVGVGRMWHVCLVILYKVYNDVTPY